MGIARGWAAFVLALCGLGSACEKPGIPESDPPRGGVAAPERSVARGDGAEPRSAPGPSAAAGLVDARTPLVAVDDPLYSRLEGAAYANACGRDSECFITGCNGEVCSAEHNAMSDCAVLTVKFPADAGCGCVAEQCVWHSATGAQLVHTSVATTPRPQASTGQAVPGKLVVCGGTTCKPGQVCTSYYGIAGSNGPLFNSCEWRCKRDSDCTAGARCRNIVDGPGRVCRQG